MADQERVIKITVQAGSSEQALKQLQNELKKTETQLSSFSQKAANDANAGLNKISKSAGQAGIQVQQFIGQVQGGQSAILAFSQQSADLGFVLGVPLLGAITGIAASLAGIFIPELFKADQAMKDLGLNTDELAKNFQGLTQEQKNLVNQSYTLQLTETAKALKIQNDEVEKLTKNLSSAQRSSNIGQGSRNRRGQDSGPTEELRKSLVAAQIAAFKLRAEYEKLSISQSKLQTQSAPGADTIEKLSDLTEKETFAAIQASQVKLGIISQESATIIQNKENELNQLDTLRDQELEKFIGTEEQRIALVEAFRQREQAINDKFRGQKEVADKNALDKEVSLRNAAINAVGGFANTMMNEAQGTNKAMFEASKALSLASAIAALPAAVMQTYKQYGATPWGAAAAAGMAITGAINIAKIASTKFDSKTGSAATTNTTGSSSTATFAPPATRSTQTETTSGNELLNELRQWNGGDLIPVEYARRIAESLAEVNRQGGY